MASEIGITNSQEIRILQEVSGMEGQYNLESLVDAQMPLSFASDNFDFQTQGFTNNQEYIVPEDQKVFHRNSTHEANTAPVLCTDEFSGDYNFSMMLNLNNTSKNWIFSERLSKAFITMDGVLPLVFQWSPPFDGLWVRATMVYKLDQHRSQPVVRCPNHMSSDGNNDKNQVRHVIRCVHPASTYQESRSGHLSVVTPLGTPQGGTVNVPIDFKFTCKNSCTAGMHRRNTEVIFTLENEQSQVLGRKTLEVRICSCPKRDKEKEENEFSKTNHHIIMKQNGKKRKIEKTHTVTQILPGKRIAQQVDSQIFNFNIEVVGKDNCNSVLKYAYDVMAGAAAKSNQHHVYQQSMEKMDKLQREFRSLSQ